MRQRVLIIEHAPGRATGFLNFVQEHSTPVNLSIWPCHKTINPPPSVFDGLIIGGGPMVVEELNAGKHPFFAREKQLILAACEQGVPILGVCLGSQILCDLHGGHVQAGTQIVGWHEVQLEHSGMYDPLFCDVNERFKTFQYHRDHLAILPTAAVILASSGATAVEAFRLEGQPIWACLFHPEMEVAQVLDVHDQHPDMFSGHIPDRSYLAPYDDGRSDRHGIIGNFFRVVTKT